MKVKICHVTSAHGKEDIRIFVKECCSLAKVDDYEVYLVQVGEEDYVKSGVQVVGFGIQDSSRIKRFLLTASRAYRKALQIDADIYHIHDPELLPYANKLKKSGKVVVFDSHEFNVGTIKEKYYIPKALRTIIAKIYQRFESGVVRRLDGVISVSPEVCNYFKNINLNVEQIANFPILTSFILPDYTSKRLGFFGGIKPEWNHEKIVDLLPQLPDVSYSFAGSIQPGYLEVLKKKAGWPQVDFKGKIPFSQVDNELSHCAVGIAILTPGLNTAGNIGTIGNTKIFEEMMAGLPVICTDFVLWRDFVTRYDCGILVDSSDKNQILSAIKKLVYNPALCKQMGANARRAVETEFCWEKDEKKLFRFYENLVKKIKS